MADEPATRYFHTATGASLGVGVLYAAVYHASFRIRQAAADGFEGAFLSWLPVPFIVRATLAAFLVGALLAFSLFVVCCPARVRRSSEVAQELLSSSPVLWWLLVLVNGSITAAVMIDAFLVQ